MLRLNRLAALVVVPLLSALPASAAPFANRAACLARAEQLPDFAFEEARLWEKQGGGLDARLCQGVALLLRADWRPAAETLESVIGQMDKEPAELRGNLWGRIGLAWQKAKEPARAEKAYDQALTLLPGDAQLRTDRAYLRAEQERWWEVIQDLDLVIKARPKQAEPFIMRAEAHRKLALSGEARADIDQALTLQPESADALLLRGNLRADAGDYAGAKADWTKVQQVAKAESSAARSAIDNLNALSLMEAKGKSEAKETR